VTTDTPKGEIVGYRLEDGEEIWKLAWYLAIPARDRHALVVAARGGDVLRIDPETGEPRWEVVLSGAGWRRPVIHNQQRVLVPVRPDSLIALDLETGDRQWGSRVGAWPRVAVGSRYAVVTTDDSLLVVLDAIEGTEIARRRLSSVAAGVSPGDTTFVTQRDGRVLAYRLPDLDLLWMRELDPPLVSPARVQDGILFLCGAAGIVHQLASVDGVSLGQVRHSEVLLAPAVVTSREIAVVGDRGTLAVFRREP
jgi:outer membrane protein assembly factor BamB